MANFLIINIIHLTYLIYLFAQENELKCFTECKNKIQLQLAHVK